MGETGTNINCNSTLTCQEEWANEDKDQQNIVIHYLSRNEKNKLVMCRGLFLMVPHQEQKRKLLNHGVNSLSLYIS